MPNRSPRTILEAHLKACRSRLESLGPLDSERLPSEHVDAAQVNQGRLDTLTERVALNETIRACEEALARIDADTFGDCERCGKLIEVKRLRVLPWALRCLDCQVIWEKEQKDAPPRSRRGKRVDEDDAA
jgi:DnaK suppressor protein